MAVHVLKTWPQYFQAITDGRKPFEVRRNDRDYHEGDVLVLLEYVPLPAAGTYSGRTITAYVSYVYSGDLGGVAEGFVVLGLANIVPES